MRNIKHINSMAKSGTSRTYRKSILGPAELIMPEERKLEEFLSLTKSLAGYITYYDFQNEPDGNWSDFFSSDPTFILADILSFDSKRHQAAFEKEIKNLQYSLFIGEPSHEKWHDMMHHIFDLLLQADGWLTAFKRPDIELSGFKKELWSTRTELQASLNDLIELHHRLEKASDHGMDLDIDSLTNFDGSIEPAHSHSETEGSDVVLSDEVINDLTQIYRQFSNSLHHLKEAAERYFVRSLSTQNHEPHAGLFITFLQLYRELSSNFNDYTKKHRSFFYDDVLKLQPEKAAPDKAILTFDVAETHDYVSMPFGTLFPAGQTDSGEDILFETTSPIALNRAVITDIKTFLLGSNELYRPSTDDLKDFVTGVYVANRTGVNFTDTKWPLLGEDQTGLLKQNRTMDDALVGFAISAPAFYLKEGMREVNLQFHIDAESYSRFLEYATKIVCSAHEPDQIDEHEEVKSLLIRLFMDGFLLDYTSEVGWVQKSQFFIDITREEEGSGCARLELRFKLQEDDPGVIGYNSEVHGLDFRKSHPVIRLRLNPDAHLFPYSVMRCLKISTISCDIKVTGLKDLIVYNEIGLVNSAEAFLPFGPVPTRNSWLAVSHPEACNKNVDSVSLDLAWEQLPDTPYGFHSHYSGYPGKIDNQSFNVRLFLLEESRWKPLEKQNRYLFRTAPKRSLKTPEPIGRLSDVTRIEDVSLVNTNFVDRPELINQIPEYTSKSRRGFLKIALTSPETAFGHKQYPLLMSNTFLQNAKVKKLKHMVQLPEEPYTPLLRRITMDYRQSLNKTVKENSERGGFDLYHIRTFDESVIINADLQDEVEFLFPQTNHRGQIIFEIAGAKPPQVLSLFFQLRDNIKDNTYTAMPTIGWEYYVNDEWRQFSKDALIRDGTNGFMNSGIVVLDLPEVLRHDLEYHAKGIIKIRAYADDHADIVGRAVGITTQAAEVRRVLSNGYEKTVPVPAGTITSVKENFQGISAIQQPLPSFGGTAPENRNKFMIRVSELLKHRGKAVISRDYERLILHKFSEVRMVNCLPGVSSENSDSDPGKVLVAVIPDVRRYPDTSRFRPRFSAGRLHEIESFLRDKTSEFATVEVRNPRYERITISCTVRFKKGIESGLYLKKLNNDISRYISPWCYDNDIAIEFGSSIDLTDIRGFIHSRPFVEMVTGLSAVKISVKSSQLYELSDTARLYVDDETGGVVIRPTRDWAVMVSDINHTIRLTDDRIEQEPERAGIENLTLGDSFIISECADDSANLTN